MSTFSVALIVLVSLSTGALLSSIAGGIAEQVYKRHRVNETMQQIDREFKRLIRQLEQEEKGGKEWKA